MSLRQSVFYLNDRAHDPFDSLATDVFISARELSLSPQYRAQWAGRGCGANNARVRGLTPTGAICNLNSLPYGEWFGPPRVVYVMSAVTSMGDDFLVGLNALHVDAMLLLADDDRPPQLPVLTLLLCTVSRDRFMRLL